MQKEILFDPYIVDLEGGMTFPMGQAGSCQLLVPRQKRTTSQAWRA